MTYSTATRAGLDDLIGAIYDCVIDPSLWHEVIDRIRLRYGFFNAMLGVGNTVSQDMAFSVSVNVPPELAVIAETYSAHIGDLWGGWSQVSAAPLEEPVLNSEVTRRENWADNLYNVHFLAPQGITDAVAIILARDSYLLTSSS